MKRAIIIIPTYNEKQNIDKLLSQIIKVGKKIKTWDLQILVVDDSSPDGTATVVENLKTKNKNIHLLVRKKKVGLGAAYLAGMKDAFEKMKADVIFKMDADLSHNPTYISKFLEKVEAGADLVIGSRYIKGGSIPKEWAIHRKVYSVLGNKIASFMLGTNKVNDWTSGYRAINKQTYKKVSPLMFGKTTQGYTFNMSFAYNTLKHGFVVSHVPIKFPDRKAGKSKLGLEYLIHTPIFLIKTRLG
jgi:dolichol-phosphate mannosyltransferase